MKLVKTKKTWYVPYSKVLRLIDSCVRNEDDNASLRIALENIKPADVILFKDVEEAVENAVIVLSTMYSHGLDVDGYEKMLNTIRGILPKRNEEQP